MAAFNNCEFWSDVVGFFLTTTSSLVVVVIVYYSDKFRKRRNIKKTINLFLRDTIIPHANGIKKEVPVAKDAIEKFYTHECPAFGTYPTFNASVLESLPISEVQNILHEDLVLFINIIGRLNNLQQRIPFVLLSHFSDQVNEHMTREHDSKRDIYDSYEDHYQRCKTIEHWKSRYSDGLDSTEDIIDKLIIECNKILTVVS